MKEKSIIYWTYIFELQDPSLSHSDSSIICLKNRWGLPYTKASDHAPAAEVQACVHCTQIQSFACEGGDVFVDRSCLKLPSLFLRFL